MYKLSTNQIYFYNLFIYLKKKIYIYIYILYNITRFGVIVIIPKRGLKKKINLNLIPYYYTGSSCTTSNQFL